MRLAGQQQEGHSSNLCTQRPCWFQAGAAERQRRSPWRASMAAFTSATVAVEPSSSTWVRSAGQGRAAAGHQAGVWHARLQASGRCWWAARGVPTLPPRYAARCMMPPPSPVRTNTMIARFPLSTISAFLTGERPLAALGPALEPACASGAWDTAFPCTLGACGLHHRAPAARRSQLHAPIPAQTARRREAQSEVTARA